MSKKNSWMSEVPTIISAAFSAYFGLSGALYVGAPGVLETAYSWLALAFGVANVAVIISTTLLILKMRTNEKWRLILAATEAKVAAPRAVTAGVGQP